nr:MAG TPA: hypothetical protein [Caudoviricetes sp.]
MSHLERMAVLSGVCTPDFAENHRRLKPTWLDRLPWLVKVEIVILWAIVLFKLTSHLCS